MQPLSSSVGVVVIKTITGYSYKLVILQTLAASHYTSDATVTVLLKERRVSPSSETKLGKAPKNVDYVGRLQHAPAAACFWLACN